MKILVPCKRVPNPEQKLKFSGTAIDLANPGWQVNPFDEYAVETALRLTEKGKGGERRNQCRRNGNIRGGLGNTVAAGHVEIDVMAAEPDAAMGLEHRQDHGKPR